MSLSILSDLHIGKRVNEYSMLVDQKYILEQIVNIIGEEKPDAVIMAGDIYDKSVPSAEAVTLFDDFLVKLSQLGKPIFIISGNHDSAERIAFGARLMKASKVYLSPVYDGKKIVPVDLTVDGVETAIYMLPFIKPQIVRQYVDDDTTIDSYDAAMRYVISQMDLDKKKKNVLITHQFITGANRSDSEDVVIGGLDNIDVSAFDYFDYVALGHLHRPQHVGRETVRYSGSPLKYSFSEVNDKKSVTMVDFGKDGSIDVRERPLTPLHDWHDLRGTYDELTAKSYYENKPYQEDYVRITLTDENDIPDGMRRLKTIYHRLMELVYDNKRTQTGLTSVGSATDVNKKTPDQLFAELFEKQNGDPMNSEAEMYVGDLIKDIFNKN